MRQRAKGITLFIFIILWVFLFVIGVSQSSSSALEGLYKSFFSIHLIIFILCWTWTNVLIMCCIASIIGELGHSLNEGIRMRIGAALSRGFFIYLLFIVSQLVLTGSLPWPDGSMASAVYISQGQYFRVCTFSSMIAFIAGYNPGFFISMLEKVKARINADM